MYLVRRIKTSFLYRAQFKQKYLSVYASNIDFDYKIDARYNLLVDKFNLSLFVYSSWV